MLALVHGVSVSAVVAADWVGTSEQASRARFGLWRISTFPTPCRFATKFGAMKFQNLLLCRSFTQSVLPELPEEADPKRDFRAWTLSLGWDETKQRHTKASVQQNETLHVDGSGPAANQAAAAQNQEQVEADEGDDEKLASSR